MTSDDTRHAEWRLEISLEDNEVKLEEGLHQGISLCGNNRAEFTTRLDFDQTSIWLVGRQYGVHSESEILEWAFSFDSEKVKEWAEKGDGDWSAIILDRTQRSLYLVSDRNGASRIYYASCVGTHMFSSSLWGILPITTAPKLSSFIAFTLLTTYYTLDPYALVEPVRVSVPGEFLRFTDGEMVSKKYYEPVDFAPDYFRNEAECVRELDRSFDRVFKKRLATDRIPIVLLSGGIDSVAMVRYVTKHSDSPVHTLTFSVLGQKVDEHKPARIVSQHFGTIHHELVIDSGMVIDLFIQSCAEGNRPNVSTMLYLAIKNYVSKLEGDYDLFTGEDTRIHTPDFDFWKRTSIWLNLTKGEARFPLLQRIVSGLFAMWPWYPKNYLRLIASQLLPSADPKKYFLKFVNKFSTPDGYNLELAPEFERLLNEIPNFQEESTIAAVFRKNMKLSYRLQYTDSVEVTSSIECRKVARHSPFFDWETVCVSNRIPFSVGAKGVFTIRSWSRFLLVNKRLLRMVLKEAVPSSILYRRKSVASAVDVLFTDQFMKFIGQLLDKWVDDLYVALGPSVEALARSYINKFRSGTIDMQVAYATLSICYMSMVNQICLNPEFDTIAELRIIEKALV
ncbi:asparagine synthase-related protein [Haliea sp. E1-2-M8]|uniref:asparagine synthase-related protein n=1 Tax=Haliea sp. E1-2-M8 TaxID=3064706 RepID=UPI0027231CF7|nr:asparagine synthetase B family protein [Haliea sp. E1-2-M8]MDO8861663.1 asparagine synthase-related protein [Haliea sp. E1-2-M8]